MFGLQLTVGSVVFFPVTLRLTIQTAMKENRAYAAGDTVRYHISQRVRNTLARKFRIT
ncbi:MAG: hypothetical protein IJ685_05015 [Selenomonadaceae bacterium]|nr:hypothetical protein [Selenomonadaceae bacterium]